MYQLKELHFNELVDLNIKVNQGKLKTNLDSINPVELLIALKKNKFFRLVKSITLTHEEQQGFFNAGKVTYFFKVKRLGNLITISIQDSKNQYHIEITK